MDKVLAVGLGGGLGAIARYLLGGWILHKNDNLQFPLGTFIINLLGCLLIGLLAGVVEEKHLFGFDLRLFVITGILGGFTTFSAFGFETIFLIKRGALGLALTYVGLSVAVGLVLVYLGERTGQLIG